VKKYLSIFIKLFILSLVTFSSFANAIEATQPVEIIITTPDDWHYHFRDDERLPVTTKYVAETFQRAIAMPNLKPPVTTTEQALKYRAQIMQHVPKGSKFEPLMTLYLTDNTSAE
jgi:dihydroorotase